eukprot:COSAG04_NODE_5152_length_1719_cov_93.847531_1_plen_126_part_00
MSSRRTKAFQQAQQYMNLKPAQQNVVPTAEALSMRARGDVVTDVHICVGSSGVGVEKKTKWDKVGQGTVKTGEIAQIALFRPVEVAAGATATQLFVTGPGVLWDPQDTPVENEPVTTPKRRKLDG